MLGIVLLDLYVMSKLQAQFHLQIQSVDNAQSMITVRNQQLREQCVLQELSMEILELFQNSNASLASLDLLVKIMVQEFKLLHAH